MTLYHMTPIIWCFRPELQAPWPHLPIRLTRPVGVFCTHRPDELARACLPHQRRRRPRWTGVIACAKPPKLIRTTFSHFASCKEKSASQSGGSGCSRHRQAIFKLSYSGIKVSKIQTNLSSLFEIQEEFHVALGAAQRRLYNALDVYAPGVGVRL